jgi:hypothetical protein
MMADYEYSHSTGNGGLKNIKYLRNVLNVLRRGDFIEQQEIWFQQQSSCKRRPLTLTHTYLTWVPSEQGVNSESSAQSFKLINRFLAKNRWKDDVSTDIDVWP